MSDFMSCVGCGATIHHTAPTCPKCGAPQILGKTIEMPSLLNTKIPTEAVSYASVPWYRRRWFVLLCVVSITPVASLLALRGEVYYSSNGIVKRFDKNVKSGLMIASLPWLMMVVGDDSAVTMAGLGLIVFALLLAFKK